MCPKALRPQRPLAFTLLELLIVIGLVAVIVAILIPALGASKKVSENTRCIANLKQVGGALLAYAADNRQMLMPQYAETENGQTVPSDSITWVQRLVNRQYLDRIDALICPSHAPFKAPPGAHGNYFQFRRCYGIRIWRRPGELWVTGMHKSLSLIKEPSKFFLVGDSFWKNHGEQGYMVMPDPVDKNQYFHFRHNRKANFAFADGSVRGLTREEILVLALEQEEYGQGNRRFLCWPLEE